MHPILSYRYDWLFTYGLLWFIVCFHARCLIKEWLRNGNLFPMSLYNAIVIYWIVLEISRILISLPMDLSRLADCLKHTYIPKKPQPQPPQVPNYHPCLIVQDSQTDPGKTKSCGCADSYCVKYAPRWIPRGWLRLMDRAYGCHHFNRFDRGFRYW